MVVGGVVVVIGEIVTGGYDLSGKVGMGPVDAGVDDGDDGLGIPLGHVPGGRGLDVGPGGHLGLDLWADVEDAAPVQEAILIF